MSKGSLCLSVKFASVRIFYTCLEMVLLHLCAANSDSTKQQMVSVLLLIVF